MVFLQALDLVGGRCSLEMRHGLLLGSWVFSSRELLYPFHCAPIFGRGLHQISTTLGGPSVKTNLHEREERSAVRCNHPQWKTAGLFLECNAFLL